MSRLSAPRLLGVLVLSAAVLGACSEGNSDASATPTTPPEVTATATVPPDTAVTSTPPPGVTVTSTVPPEASVTPTAPPDGDTVEVPAPIVSVEVIVAESFPPQYFVEVVSALPNGCHRFSHIEVTRADTEIRIDVFNTIPSDRADLACTQIYGVMTSNVALGIDFESGTEYTLLVNDVTETFVAQ